MSDMEIAVWLRRVARHDLSVVLPRLHILSHDLPDKVKGLLYGFGLVFFTHFWIVLFGWIKPRIRAALVIQEMTLIEKALEYNSIQRTRNTRGKEGGTGLGTTYAALVTRAHGGTIDVVSSEEEGTTVTVSIPAS